MWLSNAINANMIYWGKSLMWATLTTLSMGGWGVRVKFWKEILNRKVTVFIYTKFYTDVFYFSGSQDARFFLWRFDAWKSDQNYSKGWICQIVNFFFSSTPPDYSIIWAFSKEPRIEVFVSTFTFTRLWNIQILYFYWISRQYMWVEFISLKKPCKILRRFT